MKIFIYIQKKLINLNKYNTYFIYINNSLNFKKIKYRYCLIMKVDYILILSLKYFY